VCSTGAEEVDAYERLIGAALHADRSLFAREDGVLEAWRIVDALLGERTAPHGYEPGSAGPAAADALIAPDAWRPVANTDADC
jgi:glucose-6-phosphate 1-dehydrogenase